MVKLIDVNDKSQKVLVEYEAPVLHVAISPDFNLIVNIR